jgi:two-component system sensor histidine kinase VanS
MTAEPAKSGLLTWRPKMTIRARLTLTYAVMITTIGAVMLAIVYVFMRYIPTYQILGAPASRASSDQAPIPDPTASPDGVAKAVTTLAIRSEADVLNTLLVISIVVLVVLAAAGAVAGWIVAGRVLRPLQAINKAAQLAGTGSFDHRVGFTGPHDEVRELSDTFDDMLAKLDRSFQANHRFAANASHELRTPLATTQTMLEVALSDPAADVESLRLTAERVQETNRRNIEAVDSLLSLAEIGSGALHPVPGDLAEIVREALVEVADEAAERGIEIQDDLGPAPLTCDASLVRRAASNLLFNAVRHSDAGGWVEVVTTIDPDGTRALTITNSGEQLDPALVPALTEPFVRGAGRISSPSTRRGHGLGLTIVQSVADAHKGALDLEAREGGGLSVTLTLPAGSARD